jgi:hypothetical protein
MQSTKNQMVMVGFDIRRDAQHLPREYSRQLYRPAVKAVYSIEFSFFERHPSVKDYDWEEVGKSKTAEGLYYSCEEPQRVLSRSKKMSKEYVVVGFAVETDWEKIIHGYAERIGNQDYFKRARNSTSPDPNLEFLGYDVASAQYEWVSALSDCLIEDRSIQETILEGKVSDKHLILEYRVAVEFRNWANVRLESHAPFLIWGIYKCG